MVKLLLEKDGINLNSKDTEDGRTPLYATMKGHESVVRLLIKRGVNVTVADNHGVTALHLAARGVYTAILRLLLGGGALIEARMTLIDGSTDRSRRTPLHWATIEGQIGSMAALLDAGAQVDAINAWNRTPLHLAARFGDDEAVKLLVERNSYLEARCDTNETPLHFAVEENRYSVAQILLDSGADINAKSDRGTPLQYANSLGHKKLRSYCYFGELDIKLWRVTDLTPRVKGTHRHLIPKDSCEKIVSTQEGMT
jgi:ankyrin repeat protein